MSTFQKTQGYWSITEKPLESKYEKCRNITEEIYKRINITFEIKKLEGTQSEISDHSDEIDSNELSNETDLFACDKTSLSSSTDAEKPQATCEKYININNNNEETKKKAAAVYKRPKKRLRKRVKKRQSKPSRSDTDGSSDEAPLSRIMEADAKVKASHTESPHNVMGVPNIVIVANLKPKLHTSEKKPARKSATDKTALKHAQIKLDQVTVDLCLSNDDAKDLIKDEKGQTDYMNCTLCSMSFRGERGLRRHMAMSHVLNMEDTVKSKSEQRSKKNLGIE